MLNFRSVCSAALAAEVIPSAFFLLKEQDFCRTPSSDSVKYMLAKLQPQLPQQCRYCRIVKPLLLNVSIASRYQYASRHAEKALQYAISDLPPKVC